VKLVGQSQLRIVPCTVAEAKNFVDRVHRHHVASLSARYCVAVVDITGMVRGVAMVGRPVARLLDDGWTLEVTRVATDGCENACSSLYGAARRIASALGYNKLVTYTRADEPGVSLVAAGWKNEGAIRARSWNMPNRSRVDKTEVVRRQRWSICAVGKDVVPITWPRNESRQSLFDFDTKSRDRSAVVTE